MKENLLAKMAEPDPDFAAELKQMVESADAASRFLKALANENRLLLLCVLAEGEKSVTELETILELHQPKVSQQLARLRADNLVSYRRDGKAIYYSLASAEARQVIGLLYDLFCAPKAKASQRQPASLEAAAE